MYRNIVLKDTSDQLCQRFFIAASIQKTLSACAVAAFDIECRQQCFSAARNRKAHDRQSSNLKYVHLFCFLANAIDFDAAIFGAAGVCVVVSTWTALTKSTNVYNAGARILCNTSDHLGAAVGQVNVVFVRRVTVCVA